MHSIEPHYRWREVYAAEADKNSPFYGRTYSEFEFTNAIYNYYLHPQWDNFGSSTLYGKILFADYDDNFAIIELFGEWNDTLHNDVMYLKRNVLEPLMKHGIVKFVLLCDNVLNFYAALEDDYYAELYEELQDEHGWAVLLNTREHIEEELFGAHLDQYLHFGERYNEVIWRNQKPLLFFQTVEALVEGRTKRLT